VSHGWLVSQPDNQGRWRGPAGINISAEREGSLPSYQNGGIPASLPPIVYSPPPPPKRSPVLPPEILLNIFNRLPRWKLRFRRNGRTTPFIFRLAAVCKVWNEVVTMMTTWRDVGFLASLFTQHDCNKKVTRLWGDILKWNPGIASQADILEAS
jgi:F-box-like